MRPAGFGKAVDKCEYSFVSVGTVFSESAKPSAAPTGEPRTRRTETERTGETSVITGSGTLNGPGVVRVPARPGGEAGIGLGGTANCTSEA
eukprot:scaffold180904_cov32-Prasinocladus_malaysianus.AAC.1